MSLSMETRVSLGTTMMQAVNFFFFFSLMAHRRRRNFEVAIFRELIILLSNIQNNTVPNLSSAIEKFREKMEIYIIYIYIYIYVMDYYNSNWTH